MAQRPPREERCGLNGYMEADIETGEKGLTSIILGKLCRNGVFVRRKSRIQVKVQLLATYHSLSM